MTDIHIKYGDFHTDVEAIVGHTLLTCGPTTRNPESDTHVFPAWSMQRRNQCEGAQNHIVSFGPDSHGSFCTKAYKIFDAAKSFCNEDRPIERSIRDCL